MICYRKGFPFTDHAELHYMRLLQSHYRWLRPQLMMKRTQNVYLRGAVLSGDCACG